MLLAGVVALVEVIEHRLETGVSAGRSADLSWWDIGLAVVEHALIVVAAVLPALLVTGRVRAGDLGLRTVPWRPAAGEAAVVYAAYIVLTAVLFAVTGAPHARESADALARSDSNVLLAAYAFVACVLAPPTEELLFRGMLFSAFRGRLNFAPAAIGAGALFGAVHGPPVGTMLELALLGIALCVIYERTRSLIPCVGAHATHNGIAFGVIIGLSGVEIVGLTVVAATLALLVTWSVATALKSRPDSGGRFGASPWK